MSESDFFLFPASQGYSLKHLDKTIRSPLRIADLNPLAQADRTALLSIYPDGLCWAWGLPPGKANDEKWNQLLPGTLAGFIVDGLRYVSALTYKIQNPALSLNLWEKHPTRDQAFEYVFFLTQPKSVYIPIPTLNTLLDYHLRGAPQGATRIADPSARELLIEALRDEGVADIVPPGNDTEAVDLNIETPEGRSYYRKHKVYERDSKLRRAVLKKYGTACVCCGYNFDKNFGVEFKGFVEVHHLQPVSQGLRNSTVDDFAVLCSNCHTAAHYKTKIPRPINELKQRLGIV